MHVSQSTKNTHYLYLTLGLASGFKFSQLEMSKLLQRYSCDLVVLTLLQRLSSYF
jgi:hypothetical protein